MAELIFGKYEIVRRLAVGGMGEIFLARQTGVAGFDRLVILKSLLQQLSEKEENIDLFLDEARVAATLNHPNIVAIYEVGKWEGVYYIAMEYIHGVNIATLLDAVDKGALKVKPAVAAKIIHDAAMALDHAHHAKDTQGRALNIIHRDVSPQNIMVRNDGVTKVVDFGIAKAANRSTHTATGTLKGKLTYMAPEQIAALPIDARADQWALGVVLWEMLCGKRLFAADSAMETIRLIAKSTIKPPSTIVEGLPPLLDDVVMKMLSRQPAARFDRCQGVAQAWKDYIDASTARVSEVEVAEFVQKFVGDKISEVTRDLTPSGENFVISLKSSTQPVARRRRRGTIAGLAAGLALAVLGAGFGIRALLRKPPPPKPVVAATTTPPRDVPPPPAPAAAVLPARLTVSSVPPGATVSAGSRVLGTTPLSTDALDAGVTHELVVERRGHQPVTLSVRLEPGKTQAQNVILGKSSGKSKGRGKPSSAGPAIADAAQGSAAPASSGPGFLTVKTVPWTSVFAGDKLIGETTFAKVEMAPGTYTLKLVNADEGISTFRVVTIKAGEVTKLDLNLKK
ncbi:MAG: serine/threonine protein kinase [Deltaproteobacteria bacterium]|nr:serine/threonine protein kinase [Deltaproteobacteria bacterium]